MSTKKQKIEASTTTSTSVATNKSNVVSDGLRLASLESFNLQKILNISNESINLLGTFTTSTESKEVGAGEAGGEAGGEVGGEELSVVLLRRHKLSEQDVAVVAGKSNKLSLDVQNTYYGFYKSEVVELPTKFDATVINPAKPWHIDKYTKQENILFRETPELYEKLTKPYIAKHPASEIKWLHQILRKEKEQERLLFEDPDPLNGFMFMAFEPAVECIEKTKNDPDNFYSLVLVNRDDLPSLRSLSVTDLPLLQNIRDQVYMYAKQTLNIQPEYLRLFFHYKPSYFHLHVHVVHINQEMNIHFKDYLLEDVIQNIKIAPTYYQQQTLMYSLGKNDDLYKSLLESDSK